ncbi:hypothetical protein D3C73_874460 [compost metagenome]
MGKHRQRNCMVRPLNLGITGSGIYTPFGLSRMNMLPEILIIISLVLGVVSFDHFAVLKHIQIGDDFVVGLHASLRKHGLFILIA